MTEIRNPADIPAALQGVWAQVLRQRINGCNLEEWKPVWEEYLTRARERVPGITIEDGGETVRLGEISPGCAACKAGAWDCVFTTGRCNLACEFCYSPHAIHPEYAGSALGSAPSELEEKYPQVEIRGVGFSGGEPFLHPDQLVDWVIWLKAKFPGVYCWAYTNGLLAKEDVLKRLGRFGLDELRFNTAAAGYTHPVVLDNIARAARLLPAVTVEIPAIPEQADALLGALGEWAARGVRFLNLHELIFEPGTNAESMAGPRREIVLEDGHRTAVHPESRILTLAVMQRVQSENLPLAVNDCSMQSKLRQLRGRRRNLSALTRMPYERLLGEDRLETVCVAPDSEDAWFCHPDQLDQARRGNRKDRFFHLIRRAPLMLNQRPDWITLEEI